jgi:signal transduction histidine kinase
VGLALVKRIVEDNGGVVWVESAPGAGASFLVQLPAADPGGRTLPLVSPRGLLR